MNDDSEIIVGSRVKAGEYIGTVEKMTDMNVKGHMVPGAILTITNKHSKTGEEEPTRLVGQSLTLPLTALEIQPVRPAAIARPVQEATALEIQPVRPAALEIQPVQEATALEIQPVRPAALEIQPVQAAAAEYKVDASHDLPMMSIKGDTVYVHGTNNSIGIVRTRTHQGVPTIISITNNQSTTYIVTLEQDKSKPNTLTVLGTKEMESDTGGQTTESQPEPDPQPEPQPDPRLSQLRRTHLPPPVAHALSVDSVELGECITNYFGRELVLPVTLSYYNRNPALTFTHSGHENIQSVVVIPLINETASCVWSVHISGGNHIKFTSKGCFKMQREYYITTVLEHKQKARAKTLMKSAVKEGPGSDTYDKLIAWLNAYTTRSDADKQIQSEAGFLFEETSFLPESTSAPSLESTSEGALEPEPTLEPEGPSNQVISSGSQPESVRIPVERTPEKTGFLSRIFQGSGDAVADEPISDVQSEDSDIQLIIKTNKHNGNDAATLAIFKDNPNLRTQFDEMLAAAKQEAGSTSGGGKKSTRRKSTRRKSTRRKSTRRKSTRRKSTRRKSTRRKSRTRRR